MTISPEFAPALFVMAIASFACRAGGFMMMRFVPPTPRLSAALAACPLAVMIGIVVPVIAAGRLSEIAGVAVVIVMMKLRRGELLAAGAGVATVTLVRSIGLDA